jgi:hypothetical protein
MNRNRKKCCPFPDPDIHLIREGRIAANTVIPRPHWRFMKRVEKQGLEFVDDLYWRDVLL